MALIKSARLILKFVDKSFYLLPNNKFTAKMWTILEEYFQYISSINITHIFLKTCNVKLSNFKNIIDYISQYQIVFNKIHSLINNNKNSWFSRKTIKISLQENIFKRLEIDYSALVLAIKIM